MSPFFRSCLGPVMTTVFTTSVLAGCGRLDDDTRQRYKAMYLQSVRTTAALVVFAPNAGRACESAAELASSLPRRGEIPTPDEDPDLDEITDIAAAIAGRCGENRKTTLDQLRPELDKLKAAAEKLPGGALTTPYYPETNRS